LGDRKRGKRGDQPDGPDGLLSTKAQSVSGSKATASLPLEPPVNEADTLDQVKRDTLDQVKRDTLDEA